MMTLDRVIEQLEAMRKSGVPGDSPVVVEGFDEEDRFVQGGIGEITQEIRCADSPCVFLGLDEMTIGD